MKYEEALRAVGGHEHRPYQLKILLMCCLANYVSGFIMTAFPFLAYPPSYICRRGKLGNTWENCSEVCSLAADDWTYSSTSFLSLTQEYAFICNEAWLLSSIAFAQMLGGLIGTYVCGRLLDTLGRRSATLLAVSLTLFSLGVVNFTTSDYGLLGGFLLLGGGAGPLSIISKAYMIEHIGPQRSLYIQIATVAFALGRASNVIIALWTQNWRPLVHFIILVTMVLYLLSKSLFESPKYTLLYQHNVSSTLQILSKVRIYNAFPEGLPLQLEYPVHSYLIPSLFHRRYRGKLIAQCVHYFISGCGYFLIVFGQREVVGDLYLLGLGLAMTEIVSGVVAAYIADVYGRKQVYLTHFPLMCLSCSLLAVLPLSSPYLPYLNILTAYSISTCGSIPSLLAGELFPIAIRGQAGSVSSLCLRVGGLVAPVVLAYCQFAGVHPMAFVALLSLMGLGVLPLLPETRGKEVIEEETVKLTI
jgi:MFS family permease